MLNYQLRHDTIRYKIYNYVFDTFSKEKWLNIYLEIYFIVRYETLKETIHKLSIIELTSKCIYSILICLFFLLHCCIQITPNTTVMIINVGNAMIISR